MVKPSDKLEDLEARRRAAASVLFDPDGPVPSWRELADTLERLRMERGTWPSVERIISEALRRTEGGA